MKEEYTIHEFHCASGKSQPVRMSSNAGGSSTPGSSLYRKAAAEGDALRKRQTFSKTRSNTMCCTEINVLLATHSKRQDITPTSRPLVKQPVTASKSPEEDKLSSEGSSSADHNLEAEIKRRTTSDGGTISGNLGTVPTATHPEKKLADQLTESLSPSPFRNEDPGTREEKLRRLVSAPADATKNILFSSFYAGALGDGTSCHAWKIAMKDHIVNTLESISLIRKLKPVPSQLLEKKRLPADPAPNRKEPESIVEKKMVVFDLDETLAHCVTDAIDRADQTITVVLGTGESVKVNAMWWNNYRLESTFVRSLSTA